LSWKKAVKKDAVVNYTIKYSSEKQKQIEKKLLHYVCGIRNAVLHNTIQQQKAYTPTHSDKPEECKLCLSAQLMHNVSKLMEIGFHLTKQSTSSIYLSINTDLYTAHQN